MSVWIDRLLGAAMAAFNAGSLAQADALLRLLLGRGANDANILHLIGHIAYLDGRLDDAAFTLTRACGMDPTQARVHNDLGETLRALVRTEAAIAHLRRAIDLDPGLTQAYGNLSAILLMAERTDEALKLAVQWLKLGLDKVVAHAEYGRLLALLNRPRDALDQFGRAFAAGPANPAYRMMAAHVRLGLGQWQDGWAAREARLELPMAQKQSFPAPRWTGPTTFT